MDINKEYNKLLNSNPEDFKDMTKDKELNAVLNAIEKEDNENDTPNLDGINTREALDFEEKVMTVKVNPITGERVPVGIVETKDTTETILDDKSFEELWEDASKGSVDLLSMEMSDEAIISAAKKQFDLPEEDTISFLSIVREYKAGKRENIYSKLPKKIKQFIDIGAMQSAKGVNVSLAQINKAKNEVTKAVIESFISDISMEIVTEDFNTKMNELFSSADNQIGSIYFETLERRQAQLDDLVSIVENDEEDNKEERLAKIADVKKAIEEATSLESLKAHLPRIKIRHIDLEQPKKLLDGFDYKYKNCNYSIYSINLVYPVLAREFKEYNSEVITRFVLAICYHTGNMKPSNFSQHVYMYTLIGNCVFLGTGDGKYTLEEKFKTNIKECLDIIQDKLLQSK